MLFLLDCLAMARQRFSLGSQLVPIGYTNNPVLKCYCAFLCTESGARYVAVSQTEMLGRRTPRR